MAGQEPAGAPANVVGVVIVLSALSVVVAALLLIAWFLVGGGFTLIYAAMGLAAASMVLLWVARWIGSTPVVADTDPLELGPAASNPPPAAEPRDAVAVSAGRPVSEPDPAPDDAGTSPGHAGPRPDPARAAEVDSGPRFPIADYDTRWLSEILVLLDDLDDAELAVVDARERGGRHRAAVLEAIARRRPGAGVPATRPEPGAWVQGPAAGPVVPLADLDLVLDLQPTPETSGPDDPFGELDPAAQAEEDRLWAAAVPLLDQGRDPFLDDDVTDAPPTEVAVGGAVHHGRDAAEAVAPDGIVDGRTSARPGPAAAIDLTADADRARGAEGPHPDRGPRVRTFLGRRRSPVTIRHA